jgi:hypothetical protein
MDVFFPKKAQDVRGAGSGAPSMKVEVLLSFLLSAHVSKIFTFYIHRNSIVQKTYRERIGIAYIHT